MVHHYREDENTSPTSVITTDAHVQYNCQIVPPFTEAAPEVAEEPPQPEVIEKPRPKPHCCPLPTPLIAGPSSDLVEALPTILVGIGCAYLIGMASGAFIFSGGE